MKTALVTGADGGMGRCICRALLKEGYSIVMACLSTEAAMPFYRELCAEAERMAEVNPSAASRLSPRIWLHQVNLASYASVDRLASSLEVPFINRLVHNAGVLPKKTFQTEDGFEMIAQVNYLAPMYFTQKLLPLLKAGTATPEGARVIFTVSCTVYFGLFSRLKPTFTTSVPHTWAGRVIRYGNSKRAVYFESVRLAEQLKEDYIQVVSTDPGAVSTPMITMNNWMDILVDHLFRPLLSSPEQGAATAIYLCTAPQLPQPYGGTYYRQKPRKFYGPLH